MRICPLWKSTWVDVSILFKAIGWVQLGHQTPCECLKDMMSFWTLNVN